MISKIKNWFLILILILIVGRFVTQTYSRMLTNSNSAEGDQGAFLQLGLDLRERGILSDGTRNPLYAFFLAGIAERNSVYFTRAKLLSMLFGVFTIITLFWLGRKFFDPFTGLVAAYLLSINTEFIVHSATALTESLLVLFFVLAAFAMFKALDDKDKTSYWALAGVLTGMAYLAKGSGQLLAFSFLFVAFLFFRWQIFRMPGFWVFLGSYALIASPLWIYNTVHFGSPTFNYAITHQMWMDKWREWHPDDLGNLPTAFSYLQTHTPAEILERQWEGMKGMRNILVKTLWPTRTLVIDHFLLSPVSGFVFGLLAALPFIFWKSSWQYIRQNKSIVYLTTLVTFVFFMLFAWYTPIVALGQRFILPVVPLIFLLLTNIVGVFLQEMMSEGIWRKRFILLTIIFVALLQFQWAIKTNIQPTQDFFSRSVFEQDQRFFDDAATPLEWLTEQASEASVVAWGPSGHSLPVWAYSNRLSFKLYPPDADTIPELTENLVDRNVDFIIVDADMVKRYRSLLKKTFPSDNARVTVTNIPSGWALAFAYHAMPCDWCVFRLLESNPPKQRTAYQIGDSIRLTGFDISPSSLYPGDTLHLTLHWRADAAIGQDYTVFTQLLGPDFQLHGQRDSQPLGGLWPTSRWKPGEHLADYYAIHLDENAPSGEYLLLVGMYSLQTGERQTVTQNGESFPDNAIPLTSIAVEVK